MERYDAREIRAVYDRGENVIEWIRAREASSSNSATSILYSYDIQAGSYLDKLGDAAVSRFHDERGRHIAAVLDALSPRSFLDAGVGEATGLVPTLRHLKKPPKEIFGFDLSLSRLLFARKHLADNNNHGTSLFVGALDRIPLATGSIDVVMTLHSLEPNHGYEEVMLKELLRVARRHLVMIEPSYELASPEARERMDRLGYVRGLQEHLRRLGHPARAIEAWRFNSNPLNEAALIIVDKTNTEREVPPQYISPISGRPLIARDGCWFCPDDGHAFPIVAGIPCLTMQNAVLASKLSQI